MIINSCSFLAFISAAVDGFEVDALIAASKRPFKSPNFAATNLNSEGKRDPRESKLFSATVWRTPFNVLAVELILDPRRFVSDSDGGGVEERRLHISGTKMINSPWRELASAMSTTLTAKEIAASVTVSSFSAEISTGSFVASVWRDSKAVMACDTLYSH